MPVVLPMAATSSSDVARCTRQPSMLSTAAATASDCESVSTIEPFSAMWAPSLSGGLRLPHGKVALDRRHQLWKVELLLDVIVGACLQRFALVTQLVQRRDHDHAHRLAERGVLLHHAADFPAVASRHHHVEQH